MDHTNTVRLAVKVFSVSIALLMLVLATVFCLGTPKQAFADNGMSNVTFSIEGDGVVHVTSPSNDIPPFTVDKETQGEYTFPSPSVLICSFESSNTDCAATSFVSGATASFYPSLTANSRDFTLFSGSNTVHVSFPGSDSPISESLTPPPVDSGSYTHLMTAGGIVPVVPVFLNRGTEAQPEVGDVFWCEGYLDWARHANGVTTGSMRIWGGIVGSLTLSCLCIDPSAAVPTPGGASIKITITSVDKSTGTVEALVETHKLYDQIDKMAWEYGYIKNEFGYIGIQRMGADITFHRDYNGYLKLKKTSAEPGQFPNGTAGNSNYSLAGAQYGVYKDAGCTNRVAILTTDANGDSNTVEIPVGSYYVKEISAPAGFEVDSAAHAATVSAMPHVEVVSVSDTPQKGWIQLSKQVVKEAGWTLENNAYDYLNAEYGVYTDSACTQLIASKKTDKNGDCKFENLYLGKYYVKEIHAPDGYAISKTVIPTEVKPNLPSLVVSEETPPVRKSPAYGFSIEKVDYDHHVDDHGTSAQGNNALTGARYRVTYYDAYYTTPAECRAHTPWKGWKSTVITTKLVDGRAVATYTAQAVIDSDPSNVFTNDGTGQPTLPVGTYLVEEISAPQGYHLDPNAAAPKGYVLQAVRNADEETIDIRAMNVGSGATTKTGSDLIIQSNPLISAETAKRADVAINKYMEITTDPDQYPDKKKPVPGVKFQITNENDNPVRRVNVPANKSAAEKWAQKGEVIYTLTTNNDGWCSTSQLGNVANQTSQSSGALPVGNYKIREVDGTQPDGYDVIDSYDFTISYNKLNDCTLDCCSRVNEGSIDKTADNAANSGTGGDRNLVFNDGTGTVVRIVKTDSATHKQVRGSTQFQILDSNHNVMSFDLPYPQSGSINTFTTNVNGIANLPDKFMPGTYYIREVKGPDGYLWNAEAIPFTCTTQTVQDHGKYDSPMEVEFSDTPAMGVIELTKVDARTGLPIIKAPSTYGVYAAEDIVTQDGTVRALRDAQVTTITTNVGTGVVTSEPLYLGEYYIQEITPPDQYLKDPDRHSVTVSYANDRTPVTTSKITVSDNAPYGKLGIEKRDAESHNLIPEAGVTFDIYAAEDIVAGDGHIYHHKGDLIETISTNAEGRAVSERNYVLGKYEAIETVAPRGYSLNKTPIPLEVRYADGDTPQVQVWGTSEDVPQVFDVELSKLDRETGSVVLLPNTTIELRAAEDIYKTDGSLVHYKDKIVDTVVTDETGRKKTDAKDIVCGNYYLKEVTAPTGYILDSDRSYYIQLAWEDDGRAVVQSSATISDIPAKGIVSFKKVDAGTGETVKVSGCRAEVYANEDIITADGTCRAKKDEKVADLITDATGCAQTGELYLGSYRVVETFAPEGYLFNPEPVNVVLQYADENTPVVSAASRIADENAKGVIEIVKRDKETGKTVPLEGATFEIRAKTDIVTGDGTVRAHAGEVVDTKTTDGSGTCVTDPLYIGMYTVQEIVAPRGYTLDPNAYDAPVVYKDQHTPITTTSESIENVPQKGVISVTKTDSETGKTVLEAGAEFSVTAVADIVTPDGTVRAEEGEIVDTITTDDSGTAKSKALYLGAYRIVETKAPEGYLLSDEVKEVTLVYGDQHEPLVYEMVSVADRPVKGRVSVKKEDSDLDEPLANVEYEIRAAEDVIGKDGTTWHKKGEVADHIVTDESGVATSKDLPLGEYVVVETVQPNGYELDTKEYAAHLRYEGQFIEVVHSDHTLYNTPSSLFVKKVSTSDLSKTLPDTQFIGWNKNDEADEQTNFAIFAKQDYEVVKACIDYLGPLTNEVKTKGANRIESFELRVSENGNDQVIVADGKASASALQDTEYTVYSSDEKPMQGSYIMHLTYKHDGEQLSNSFEFVINEHDTNAVFALGDIVQDEMVEAGNCFAKRVTSPDEGTSDPSENNIDTDDTGSEDDGVQVAPDASDQDAVDAKQPINDAGSANTDSVDDYGAGANTDETEDSKNGAVQHGSNIAKRVPVILSRGTFAHSVTDENGLAEFKYVQQGEVGFSEYVPPAGYASDRTPQYVTFSQEGVPVESDVTEKFLIENALTAEALGDLSNVSIADTDVRDDTQQESEVVGEHAIIGLRFADDEIKLTISKRDITNSEELPGNVLSVYESSKDDTIGTDGEIADADYGELIETWVSTNEPHMMELLPQGTYILKEEQAVAGYTVAEDIMFQLNDTGVVQQVTMHNEHEAAVADELVETLGETGVALPILVIAMFIGSGAFAFAYRKRENIARLAKAVRKK